ncbi:hypothetical protein BCR37DRAFT_280027 [Protomyces lactucae-debilis]|uniref:Uncharacterized protein n=1 Tax=Protomyces lactucae-debilis TaxID=2754530 RepID=A0A1Y2FIJ7_PROLT|nr:uncharacterized protein BCR37DRAFT_280027 [Protomyces lactucae-debilis]ORY83792.1 hypothetical protein BCR37DRAFT_280027 [Protomyces lactucae-debilis]
MKHVAYLFANAKVTVRVINLRHQQTMSSHLRIIVVCFCWIISLLTFETEAAPRFTKDHLGCRQYAMARSIANFTLLHQYNKSSQSYWPPGATLASKGSEEGECALRCRDMVDAVALISAIAGDSFLGADAIYLLQAQKAYLSSPDPCAGDSGACLDYYYEEFNDHGVATCNCFAVILIMRVHKHLKEEKCDTGDVVKRLNAGFAPYGFQFNKDAIKDDVHCGARGANECTLSDLVGFRKMDVCHPTRDYTEATGL